MKNIFIVIVNFNTREITLNCLKSLHKLKAIDFNISTVVVDNGSSEEFNIKEKDFEDLNLKFIRSKENLGFTGGNNLGIKFALDSNANYVMLLNNDTFVNEELILKLFNSAEENLTAGIVVPKIYFARGYEYHKDRYKKEELGKVIWYAGGETDWKNVISYHRGVDEVDKGQFDNRKETNFATGCCMFIARKVLEKIGMLDDKYFLYYEDGDFCQRVKKAGFKIIYEPKAFLWHENSGSTGGSGSHLQDYYISRNRMLFGIRYAPFRSKLALIKESLRILGSGRKWQKKGIMDFYLNKFGKGSYKNE